MAFRRLHEYLGKLKVYPLGKIEKLNANRVGNNSTGKSTGQSNNGV